MRLALNVVSVAASLLAAWLWWRASQQPPPALVRLEDRSGGTVSGDFQAWARSSAQWNSWAARCTAAAVVLQAASGFSRQ
jgi:hypothetical protein